MLNQLKYGCALLFALPAIAMARPVTITSHTTGSMTVNPDVMVNGLRAFDFTGTGTLPYELTLASRFDDGGALPERGVLASTAFIDVTIDFHIGDFDYHYAGPQAISFRLSTLDGGTDRFEHIVDQVPNSQIWEYTDFTQAMSIPSGSLGGTSLVPGHVESTTTSGNGYATIVYNEPMFSGMRATMEGTIDTYSLDVTTADVTSPVPEPATYAMLAAGVLTLGWRRRLGRKAQAATGTA